jgi:hypothetical protein
LVSRVVKRIKEWVYFTERKKFNSGLEYSAVTNARKWPLTGAFQKKLTILNREELNAILNFDSRKRTQKDSIISKQITISKQQLLSERSEF